MTTHVHMLLQILPVFLFAKGTWFYTRVRTCATGLENGKEDATWAIPPRTLEDVELRTPVNRIRRRNTSKEFHKSEPTSSAAKTRRLDSIDVMTPTEDTPPPPAQPSPQAQEPCPPAQVAPGKKKLKKKKTQSLHERENQPAAGTQDKEALPTAETAPSLAQPQEEQGKTGKSSSAKAKPKATAAKAKAKAGAGNSQTASAKSRASPTSAAKAKVKQQAPAPSKEDATTAADAAQHERMAEAVKASIGRAQTSDQLAEPPDKTLPDVRDTTAKKPKAEKTIEQRAAHARFMRFSRSLQSACLSCRVMYVHCTHVKCLSVSTPPCLPMPSLSRC